MTPPALPEISEPNRTIPEHNRTHGKQPESRTAAAGSRTHAAPQLTDDQNAIHRSHHAAAADPGQHGHESDQGSRIDDGERPGRGRPHVGRRPAPHGPRAVGALPPDDAHPERHPKRGGPDHPAARRPRHRRAHRLRTTPPRILRHQRLHGRPGAERNVQPAGRPAGQHLRHGRRLGGSGRDAGHLRPARHRGEHRNRLRRPAARHDERNEAAVFQCGGGGPRRSVRLDGHARQTHPVQHPAEVQGFRRTLHGPRGQQQPHTHRPRASAATSCPPGAK